MRRKLTTPLHAQVQTVLVLLLSAAMASGCADRNAESAEAPRTTFERTSARYLERATQVAVGTSGELIRLDAIGSPVPEGVGNTIFLNSELIEGGTHVEGTFPPEVDGGTVVGTSHGICRHLGGGLSLEPEGNPGLVGKCEQFLVLDGEGQVVVAGMIHQDDFEAGVPQTLAVVGGTGRYRGAWGELTVTQLTFPGILKQLDLDVYIPAR